MPWHLHDLSVPAGIPEYLAAARVPKNRDGFGLSSPAANWERSISDFTAAGCM
jgi:hypothetical protein